MAVKKAKHNAKFHHENPRKREKSAAFGKNPASLEGVLLGCVWEEKRSERGGFSGKMPCHSEGGRYVWGEKKDVLQRGRGKKWRFSGKALLSRRGLGRRCVGRRKKLCCRREFTGETGAVFAKKLPS